MDSSLIIYTGLNLPHIGVVGTDNETLEAILGKIDDAIENNTSAPDFSGWNLYCVTQIDGVTHPTTIENFSKGISKILCDHIDDYTTFVDDTYTTDQGVITSALNNLVEPGYIYAPFSIVDTDTITQVFTKMFSGFTAITDSISPEDANWSSLSVADQTTIVTAFNAIIAYELAQDANIDGKEDALGTFDASALGGGATDTATEAIDTLLDYVSALPAYDSNNLTWTCISQGGTLETDIDNIIAKVALISANYIAGVGTGLTSSSIGACIGYEVAVDEDWVGLFKVAVDVTDAGTAPGYLEDKVESSDSSVTITNTGDTLDFTVTTPVDGKVKVTSGGTANYLENKIPSSGGDWGMSIDVSVVSDQLILTPKITNPGLFLTNFIVAVTENADIKTQLCSLLASCSSCDCNAPTGLTVEVTTV